MAGGGGGLMGARPDSPLDLVLLAGNAASRDELYFIVVNRSVVAVRYDRASLWGRSSRPALLAVSGNVQGEARSTFSVGWSDLLRSLRNRKKSGLLGEDAFARPEPWRKMAARTEGLSALWLPVPGQDAGVLFERWAGSDFAAEEERELANLVAAYGLVWRKRGRALPRKLGRRLLWLAVVAGIAAAMALVRVPLRVVAMCEVTARSPRLISAPMEGVIDEVLVAPGQRVAEGDRIAVYDSRLMEEELKISRRQVAVVEAELAGSRARGFSDARYRGQTAIFEARLEQEMARLEALEVRFERREILAPVGGMVQLDDARAWRGRPVSTGQAIMWLVDPDDTRLTIWLPQDDRIDFDLSRPVSIHLTAIGGEARTAGLTYVSSFSQPTPDGVHAFPAEAEWLDGAKSPPLGLRGTAAIYGEKVTLGYWLMRRPLAWARRWLGV